MKAERNHARLYRSSDDVVIAGVCAGVADYLGLPSGKVRLATLLLVLVGGLSIWVYILLWIVVPKGPKRLEGNSRYAESGPGLPGERFAYFRYADRTRLLKYEIRNSMYKQR